MIIIFLETCFSKSGTCLPNFIPSAMESGKPNTNGSSSPWLDQLPKKVYLCTKAASQIRIGMICSAMVNAHAQTVFLKLA